MLADMIKLSESSKLVPVVNSIILGRPSAPQVELSPHDGPSMLIGVTE